jgi:[ribosomal protein S5]-alanine N-acetyltransferase
MPKEMKAPERIETNRPVLRKPALADAEAVFARYASDPDVTKFMGWRRHESVEETRAFLAFSDAEWERWPAGPYLIEAAADGQLLGATGLKFQTPTTAVTGYVLAQDAWGYGYATEALRAMVTVAMDVGVHQLSATCHSENLASARVLEKGGFVRAKLPGLAEFPNLSPGQALECLVYLKRFLN